MAIQIQILVLLLGTVALNAAGTLVQDAGGDDQLTVTDLAEPQCFLTGRCSCLPACQGSEYWVHDYLCNQTKEECRSCNFLWCDFGNGTGGGATTTVTTTGVPVDEAFVVVQKDKTCTAMMGATACTTPECTGSAKGCYDGLKPDMMEDCMGSRCCGSFFDWSPNMLCECPTLNGGNPACASQSFSLGTYILEAKEEFLSPESSAVTASRVSLAMLLVMAVATMS